MKWIDNKNGGGQLPKEAVALFLTPCLLDFDLEYTSRQQGEGKLDTLSALRSWLVAGV